MSSSDNSDYQSDSDQELDAKQHKNLLQNVLNLNKKRFVSKPSRTEPTLEVSEFNLVNFADAKDGKVELNDLTTVLKKSGNLAKLDKQLNKIERKSKILPKPLEKPRAERIRRAVGYEKTRFDLDKWDAVVTAHRGAEHLRFPLQTDVKLKHDEKPHFTYRVKSELEKELEEINPKVEVFNIEENRVPLTMKEILEKRREAAKLRAHMSFREAKARRQNKIKSKKYHRIQRREKIKKQLEEFELLQKTNPEAALEKLDEIEKARAEERISLRHKSTGKWARSKQIRAKYDKESRKILAQQLTLSKELTQKIKTDDASESDGEDIPIKQSSISQNNPWIKNQKSENEIDQFLSGYRKFWEDHNKNEQSTIPTINGNTLDNSKIKIIDSNDEVDTENVQIEKVNHTKKKAEKRTKRTAKKNTLDENNSKSTSEWNVSSINDEIDQAFESYEKKLAYSLKVRYGRIKKKLKQERRSKETHIEKEPTKIDLSLSKTAKRPVIDKELIYNDDEEKDANDLTAILSNKTDATSTNNKKKHPDLNIKEVKIIQLNTKVPDLLVTDDNEENLAQREAIAGAFEDEDIVEDFNKEKCDDIEKNKPKDIDLSLPGWGTWGGKDLPILKRKKKRFIIKMPKKMPRRDENKGNVIIYEGGNRDIKSHLVSDLPFPFKTVKDFEASIRAPIGNTFVTETAFRKLTLPAIKTKMGAIIEPLNEDILLKKKYNV